MPCCIPDDLGKLSSITVGCGPGVIGDISQVWGIRYLTDSSSNRFGEGVRQVPPPLKHSTVC